MRRFKPLLVTVAATAAIAGGGAAIATCGDVDDLDRQWDDHDHRPRRRGRRRPPPDRGSHAPPGGSGGSGSHHCPEHGSGQFVEQRDVALTAPALRHDPAGTPAGSSSRTSPISDSGAADPCVQ